jgi:hypothetical protein
MSGEGYRILLCCRSRGDTLRGKRFTWDQIADVMALDNRVSPLRLYRLAHGRTATDVVNAFNDLDPAGTSSLRESRLFDFEAWPVTGRRPTSRVLAVLARIYQTRARNLVSEEVFATYTAYDRDVIDQADFRHFDTFQAATHCSVPQQGVSMEKAEPAHPRQSELNERYGCGDHDGRGDRDGRDGRDGSVGTALSVRNCRDLLRAVSAEEADMKRRELLFELSLALGGIPALALLRHLDPGEEERLARVVRSQGRVDAQTVATIEKLTAQCRRLDDTYGPAKVLPVVEAQRDMVARLLTSQTLLPGLRTRLVHVYAELAQLSGFLHYDQMNFHAAERSFDRGLDAAQETGDAVLTAYIHKWASEMASFSGQSGKALDHAFAAQGWARRGGSNLMRSRADVAEAWAQALHGNTTESLRKLESARSWAGRPTSSEPPYLYWVNAYQGVGTTFWFVYNSLGRPNDVMDAVTSRLATVGPAYKRERVFGLIQQGMALTQSREIPEAATRLSEAVTLTREHSSVRLGHLIGQARRRLEPWSGNAYVRNLDEKLRATPVA